MLNWNKIKNKIFKKGQKNTKTNCVDKIFENTLKRNKDVKEQEIAKFLPMIGFVIEILLEIAGIFILYLIINKLAYIIVGKSFNADFLYALIFLPLIEIIRQCPKITQSCFARVGVGEEFIICKTGYIRKFIDKLYVKNIDNIEVYTSIWGEWFNYGSITLYSFGGNIHLPFLKNPYKVYAFLKKRMKKNKAKSPNN